MTVSYVGERGMDGGGLFRDFHTVVARDLAGPECGDIFVPAGEAGRGREAELTPAPGASAVAQVALEVVGMWLGGSLRSGEVLPVSLARDVWAYLCSGTLAVPPSPLRAVLDAADAHAADPTSAVAAERLRLRPPEHKLGLAIPGRDLTLHVELDQRERGAVLELLVSSLYAGELALKIGL